MRAQMTPAPSWFRWQGTALHLELAVQPGARRNEVVGLHGSRLKVRIQSPPVDGKANDGVITMLAELFATPARNVEILRGTTSRNKTVAIHGIGDFPAVLTNLGLVQERQ